MILQRASKDHVQQIMQIIEEGRQAQLAIGLEQWVDGYPNEEIIKADIEAGISYLLVDNGVDIATVALDPNGEEVYDTLRDGSWASTKPYLTIHRLAVSTSHASKGVGSILLQHIETLARTLGFTQIRVDTHVDNVVMKRVIEKNNYRYAGLVNYNVPFDCCAYDKQINS